MNGIKLISVKDAEYLQANGIEKNFIIKYEKEDDGFKLGFMASRESSGPGEPKFYPVWITKIDIAPVVRQMFGNELVDRLMGCPQEMFFLDVWIEQPAKNILTSWCDVPPEYVRSSFIR